MIRFCVQDEDVFGDPNFLGQATIPVRCLRSGNVSRNNVLHTRRMSKCFQSILSYIMPFVVCDNIPLLKSIIEAGHQPTFVFTSCKAVWFSFSPWIHVRGHISTCMTIVVVRSCDLGYRSIQLLNDYSEPLELASLLVKIDIVNPNVSVPHAVPSGLV